MPQEKKSIKVFGQMVEQRAEDFGASISVGTSAESQYLDKRITDVLLSLPFVETVYIDKSSSTVQVWTIVDDPAEEDFDKIYSRERAIIQDFSGERFDFSVVARRGRATRSLISLACPGWTKAATLDSAG